MRSALTVWAVAVPQSLAYATLAGVPSVHGLYAAVAALTAYAIFGTCRDLNMGAESTVAIMAAATIAPLALGTDDVVSLDDFKALWRLRRSEFVPGASTVVAVLVFDMLGGIAFAIGLSLLVTIAKVARLHTAVLGRVAGTDTYRDLDQYPDATLEPGLLIYRVDEELFFENAAFVVEDITEHLLALDPPATAMVLDAEGVSDIDSTAIEAIADLVAELKAADVELSFARVRKPVRAAAVPKSCTPVVRVLRDNGYVTGGFGRWHLAPDNVQGAAGRFDRWPSGWGFDHWWGSSVAPPGSTTRSSPRTTGSSACPKASTASSTTSPTTSRTRRSSGSTPCGRNRPRSRGSCTTRPVARHAPHHVGKDWADKHEGRFDEGWDAYRQQPCDPSGRLVGVRAVGPCSVGLLTRDDEAVRSRGL